MPQVDPLKAKQIFVEAAELDPIFRPDYLQRACGGDIDLRARVEELLQSSDETATILDADNVGVFLTQGSPSQTLISGDRVGRFEIIGLIGKGGMGEVYEALDLHFGDHVALKTIRSDFLTRPDYAARFRREIQLARKVTHPNVCRIYDVGRHTIRGSDVAFLTMELLTGETLCERMQRGPVPLTEAIPIIRQMAEGLCALHNSQVIHRDFKPANVLLVQSPQGMRVVITDFGLAHNMADTATAENLTIGGQLMGTPAYMAPEQLSGRPVGPPADIFSLGLVMYELLAGRRPYDGESISSSFWDIRSASPDAPGRYAALNSNWNTVVLRCLNTRIEKRPQSMQQVLDGIDLAIAEKGSWRSSSPKARWLALQGNKPVVYALVAASAIAIVPAQIPALRKPVLRELCEAVPGTAAVCALPADLGIAVLPFTAKGPSPATMAASAGLGRYIRESFERLFPNPNRVCVHLRKDQLADGVALVLEGDVENTAENFALRFRIREAKGQNGHAPLVLRQIDLKIPASNAKQLHSAAVRAIFSALNLQPEKRSWEAWQNAGPRESDSFIAYLQGLGFLEASKFEEAVREFTAALDPSKDFAFAPAQVGLADAYRLLRNRTGDASYQIRAEQAYQRAVPLDRDFGFAGAQKRWGELAAATGRPEEAVEHFSAALAFWPFDVQVVKGLAGALEAAGVPDRAEELLKNAAARSPRCWLAHNTIADFYSRHGRLREAEKELLEVIRLAPDSAIAYNNLAFDYVKVGRFDDAIDMASRSIRLRPFSRSYSTLGRAYLYRSCKGDALVNLRKAVEVDPKDFVAWANLAEGLSATEPVSSAARESFAKTVELSAKSLERSPADAYARAQHALNLTRLGNVEQGNAEAERALQSAGASNDIRLIAVTVFETGHQRKRALDELERALRNGLPLQEVESNHGLTILRRDAAYGQLLERLHLKRSTDPGGLTLPTPGCPESGKPGIGLSAV